MFTWNDKKILLYQRGEEATLFNRKVSNAILEIIGYDRIVWDIGCGLGYLSLYLSENSNKVVAVDVSHEALSKLREMIEDREIGNIHVVEDDFKAFLEGNNDGDVLIVSHFLRMEEHLDFLLEHCKTLIIIKNSSRENNLYNGCKATTDDVERILMDRDIQYNIRFLDGDFGQPLKSMKEADEYFDLYNGEGSKESYYKRIVPSDKGGFPLYFTKEKHIGIISIEKKE